MSDAVAAGQPDESRRTCKQRPCILLIADGQTTLDALGRALHTAGCEAVEMSLKSGHLVLVRRRSGNDSQSEQSGVVSVGESAPVSCGVTSATGSTLSDAESLAALLTRAAQVDLASALEFALKSTYAPPCISGDVIESRQRAFGTLGGDDSPIAIAERWASFAFKGCIARHDPNTISRWADECAVSYSTLTEVCRLNAMKPLCARDFVRVLRALRRASLDCGAPDAHLAVSDSRTLRALSKRAGIDLEMKVRSRVVPQFLASQMFLDSDSDGFRAMARLVGEW